MAQHIKIPETKIITKNGETILSIIIEPIIIEVNVNVNSSGSATVESLSAKPAPKEETLEEKINWAVPTFETKKIKFGK